MKIEVIKPQEEVKWKFPCIGVDINDNDFIVAFTDNRKGIVLKQGNEEFSLREYREDWKMHKFMMPLPSELNPQPIDWDKVELPIWAVRGEWIMKIENIGESTLDGLEFQESLNNIQGTRLGFKDKQDRDKYLNSLEILPKGTKIIIEL